MFVVQTAGGTVRVDSRSLATARAPEGKVLS